MCQVPKFILKADITREEIPKLLCGDEECPGCKLFAEIGIVSLAKQAKEIIKSEPCCIAAQPITSTQAKYLNTQDGDTPCRNKRRCEISRITKLPELRLPDPTVGTFCGNQNCPMAYLISPGPCNKEQRCQNPECPLGTRTIQTQSPEKLPCKKADCPWLETAMADQNIGKKSAINPNGLCAKKWC